MMFVQISKGRRRVKADTDSQSKDDSEDTSTPEPETPTVDSSEGFSGVDLSPKHESGTVDSQHSQDHFFDRLKRSSVGKLFKNTNKEQDISIYTIEHNASNSGLEERRVHSSDLMMKQRHNIQTPSDFVNEGRMRSVASQANDYPPLRLHFIPPSDWRESDTKFQAILKLIFCQCSLACFLLIWLIMGALILYLTEGPYEEQLVEELDSLENSTMVSMATDLRLLDPEFDPWDDVLIKYTQKHRDEVISLIMRGYKNDTTIWTFPGSILSAISILTTLGLAAPLPQTTEGIIVASIFGAFGIPVHLIFILHLGRTVATRVQLFAKEAENKASDLRQRIINVRRFGEDKKRDTWPEQMFLVDFVPPSWLAYFPILSTIMYYLIGLLVFGVARGQSPSETFIFFIDFSKGYPTNGFSKMGYCWYLEGAAILTGLNIAILRDSPLTGFSQLVQPYGLLTNSID